MPIRAGATTCSEFSGNFLVEAEQQQMTCASEHADVHDSLAGLCTEAREGQQNACDADNGWRDQSQGVFQKVPLEQQLHVWK